MKLHNTPQGTDEWFKLRLGKFTASNAQAIANDGKGLETLCFEKVAELKTGKAKESYTNEDIERGKTLEEMARNSYELETGIVAKQIGFVEATEFIGCSPDGLIDEDGLLEIKCKNDANFVKYLYDKKIDPAHVWQMQMQMYVCERDWCDYVIFNENFEKTTIIVRVKRDPEAILKIGEGLLKGQEKVKEILSKI